MAKFWKEPHKVTAYPGQPYRADVLKAFPELKKSPWFGKALAYEAKPLAGTLTALSGIRGVVARIDKHEREGNRVHLIPNLKPYTELTIVFAHLGKVLVRNGTDVGYTTPIGLVSPQFKFTGKGTGNHIAIYAWKTVHGKKVYPDVRVIETIKEPAAVVIAPPKPVVDPCKETKEKLANVEKLRRIDTEVIVQLTEQKATLERKIETLQDSEIVYHSRIKELEEESAKLREPWTGEIGWTLLVRVAAEKIKEIFKHK